MHKHPVRTFQVPGPGLIVRVFGYDYGSNAKPKNVANTL